MSKLLNEQELQDEIRKIAIQRAIVNPDDRRWLADQIIPLIKSQKQAHADMVIGEDPQWENTISHDVLIKRLNQQRERNQL